WCDHRLRAGLRWGGGRGSSAKPSGADHAAALWSLPALRGLALCRAAQVAGGVPRGSRSGGSASDRVARGGMVLDAAERSGGRGGFRHARRGRGHRHRSGDGGVPALRPEACGGHLAGGTTAAGGGGRGLLLLSSRNARFAGGGVRGVGAGDRLVHRRENRAWTAGENGEAALWHLPVYRRPALSAATLAARSSSMVVICL